MSDALQRGDADGTTRRRFLIGAGAIAAGGVAAGAAVAAASSGSGSVPEVALGEQPAGLPARQYAWEQTLARDRYGNPIAPRFDRLLFFDVAGTPDPRYARMLEASLRTLERAYRWGPSGLLFTVSWGHDYFRRVLGVASPVPPARPMSAFELPEIDEYHCCIHLAADDEQRLAAIEAALLHGAPLPGARGAADAGGRSAGRAGSAEPAATVSLAPILRWRETRTGFLGAGLPAAHQRVGGVPPGDPIPRSAPMYMGFKSNLKRNQATEEAITIPDGAFAQGTTMTVSYMRLRLDTWYQILGPRGRVARMYSPQTTLEDARRITTDAPSDPGQFDQAVTRYGVVGHSQATARARRNGKPIILRRDFDTADGGQAGLHFVSLQRSIDDFIATRTAMNAASAQLQNPAVTDTVNNGVNEFIFVLKRGNYILPSRAERAFPLLPGRSGQLV